MTAVYRVYGRRLASTIVLPEIDGCDGAPDWRFSLGALDVGDCAWFDIWPIEGAAPWVRASRTPNGYRIRYEGRADFSVDADLRTIVCEPRACPEAMMRHFLLDQVLPLTFSLDAIVLHASGVVFDDGFVAFIGPGGAGKSTLALALGRAGCPIGSDDGLLVDTRTHVATPSYPSVRVWEDSAEAVAGRRPINDAAPPTAKRQYRDGFVFVSRRLPLRRVYILDREPGPSIHFTAVSPRETAIALVEQSYRLALDDRGRLSRQLDDLVGIARHVPAWRLSWPRRLDGWKELADAVIDHVERTAASEVA